MQRCVKRWTPGLSTRLGLGLLLALGLGPFGLAQGLPVWAIGPFTRTVSAPVIAPKAGSMFRDPVAGVPVPWEALHTFNPAAALAPDGTLAVLYRAEDASGSEMIGGHTSRLGYASSRDGVSFQTEPVPVLYPDRDAQAINESPGGVEDPRIVRTAAGLYVMTYTQYARDRHIYTAGVATSRDLHHWTKYGPVFQDAGEPYQRLAYKSAGILQELRGGALVAAQVGGWYWMYWGEGVIGIARSHDLIHWTPLLDPATGKPLAVLGPRAGKFDSAFPEVGPPPILTARGIVMVYNAKNAPAHPVPVPADPVTTLVVPDRTLPGDPAIGEGTYSVGEALFSATDPTRLLDRTSEPVFQPEQAFERSGQYTAGTTFADGLVPFHGRWVMLYGCADSFVGVASAPLNRQGQRRRGAR